MRIIILSMGNLEAGDDPILTTIHDNVKRVITRCFEEHGYWIEIEYERNSDQYNMIKSQFGKFETFIEMTDKVIIE